MLKLDTNKLRNLKSFDNCLDEQYGEENSVERKEFEAKAEVWYRTELYKANIKDYGQRQCYKNSKAIQGCHFKMDSSYL